LHYLVILFMHAINTDTYIVVFVIRVATSNGVYTVV
jgi:hypothetical protein